MDDGKVSHTAVTPRRPCAGLDESFRSVFVLCRPGWTAGDRLLSRSREPGGPGVRSGEPRRAPRAQATWQTSRAEVRQGARRRRWDARAPSYPPIRGPQQGPCPQPVCTTLSLEPGATTAAREGCRLAHTDGRLEPGRPAAQDTAGDHRPDRGRPAGLGKGGRPCGGGAEVQDSSTGPRGVRRQRPTWRDAGKTPAEPAAREEPPDTGAAPGGLLRGRGRGRQLEAPPPGAGGQPAERRLARGPGGPGRRDENWRRTQGNAGPTPEARARRGLGVNQPSGPPAGPAKGIHPQARRPRTQPVPPPPAVRGFLPGGISHFLPRGLPPTCSRAQVVPLRVCSPHTTGQPEPSPAPPTPVRCQSLAVTPNWPRDSRAPAADRP
ncbi:basic salivary proline-rich protein 1-like [Phyllostomus hastatus]|uniref:basic salivary proline-rich protein 1-like n=1 Tax=Phyllostomus hastatus TaxID=9423 RepID=UPI001E6838D5|nr:basic salivary proline-rich protein 1-like [Phyllostomus hastatus]